MSGTGAGRVLALFATLTYLFLLGPVLIVFVISFSADAFIVFPPSGLSLQWYGRVFGHPALMEGLRLSLIVGAIVAALSLVIGVPAAWALAKGRFPGREALANLFLAPILLPTLVLGLALLLAFQPLRLTATIPGLVIGHLCVTLPFVVRMMTTAFQTIPDEVEAAAATLGAPPWRVAWKVTLPLAAPGLAAAGALSFLLSFDETVVSLFLSGPRASTLPVEMVRYVEGRTDPMIAALSTLLVAGTIASVLVVERFVGIGRALGR
jgi:putative spermidine/putrescine transport system permease protein